jgi:hypothetical protein
MAELPTTHGWAPHRCERARPAPQRARRCYSNAPDSCKGSIVQLHQKNELVAKHGVDND